MSFAEMWGSNVQYGFTRSPSHHPLLPLSVKLQHVDSIQLFDLSVEGRFTQDLKDEDLWWNTHRKLKFLKQKLQGRAKNTQALNK